MKTEIILEGMTFYAFHGYYEEERKAGNRFIVDVKIKTDIPETIDFDNLDNTINYEGVYEIVKSQMNKSYKLLEQVAKNILESIYNKWSFVESAEVSISKLSPPVGGPCNKAKVTLVKSK
jgi:dihydroneopterin aldolase